MKSAVGRTAQWSAALRGVESLEVNGALFKDELAGVLAGKRAFSRAVKDVQVRCNGSSSIFKVRYAYDFFSDG